MINFRVGQEVVCINNEDKTGIIKTLLTVGQKYTIRWIGPYNFIENGNFVEKIALRVLGIKRPPIHKMLPQHDVNFINNLITEAGYLEDYFDDPPFFTWRFRPLDNIEKGMDVLKGLLNSKELPSGDDDDGGYMPKVKELEDV